MLGVLSLLEAGDTQGGLITWGPRPHLQVAPKVPPAAFDAREFWNGETGKGLPGFNCSTMVTVENQGGCGSCWAFGSVEAFQDRTCVATGGKVSVVMATQEPTSCVGCMKKSGKGYDPEGFNASCTYNGCGGGSPHTAWEWLGTEGVVSAGCWPYGGGNTSAPVWDPKHNKTRTGPQLQCNETEMGERKCVDGSPWKAHFANTTSIVGLNQIVDIQHEIMAHGPVTAAFKVDQPPPCKLRHAPIY